MADLEKWLLSTVPGVIVLGAIGSVIAVGILKVCAIAIASWFPKTYKWWRFQKNLELVPHGWLQGYLTGANNIPVLLVYFTFRTMKFIAWLFVCGLSFLTYIHFASSAGEAPLNPLSATFMLFAFAGFYLAVQQIRIIRIMYDREVLPVLKQVKEAMKSSANGNP